MQLSTLVERRLPHFDRGCQKPSCKNVLSNILCVGIKSHVTATFRHCDCTPLEQALGTLNLVLAATEPPVAVSTDILTFYATTKALSTGPIASLGHIIETVCRGNDVQFDSSMLADEFPEAIGRFEAQFLAKALPPSNVPNMDPFSSSSQPHVGHDNDHVETAQNTAVDEELLKRLSRCTIDRHYGSPDNCTVDQLTDVLSSLSFVHRTVFERPNSNRFSKNRLIFAVEDLECLRKPDACFTATLMHACVWLLRDTFSTVTASRKCTLFSPDVWATFLVRGVLEDQEQLLRITEWQDYWAKTLWMFPLCENNHWCLGIVNVQARSIHVFDSLSRKANLDVMCSDLLQLTVGLAAAASQLSQTKLELPLDGWNAYPLTHRLQTNSYDCGAWVLACATAVLRGYSSVEMTETQITEFRRWLLAQALSLPVTRGDAV